MNVAERWLYCKSFFSTLLAFDYLDIAMLHQCSGCGGGEVKSVVWVDHCRSLSTTAPGKAEVMEIGEGEGAWGHSTILCLHQRRLMKPLLRILCTKEIVHPQLPSPKICQVKVDMAETS